MNTLSYYTTPKYYTTKKTLKATLRLRPLTTTQSSFSDHQEHTAQSFLCASHGSLGVVGRLIADDISGGPFWHRPPYVWLKFPFAFMNTTGSRFCRRFVCANGPTPRLWCVDSTIMKAFGVGKATFGNCSLGRFYVGLFAGVCVI